MKNNLMECKSCGAEISKSATKCPHCGQAYTNAGRILMLALIAIFVCWFLGAFRFLPFLFE